MTPPCRPVAVRELLGRAARIGVVAECEDLPVDAIEQPRRPSDPVEPNRAMSPAPAKIASGANAFASGDAGALLAGAVTVGVNVEAGVFEPLHAAHDRRTHSAPKRSATVFLIRGALLGGEILSPIIRCNSYSRSGF
jgi:hypothetical protein